MVNPISGFVLLAIVIALAIVIYKNKYFIVTRFQIMMKKVGKNVKSTISDTKESTTKKADTSKSKSTRRKSRRKGSLDEYEEAINQ